MLNQGFQGLKFRGILGPNCCRSADYNLWQVPKSEGRMYLKSEDTLQVRVLEPKSLNPNFETIWAL